MKLQAEVNSSQLDEVDVTITVTMKLREWKMISKSVRSDAKSDYNFTKHDFADKVGDVIDTYTDKVERTIEMK